MSQVFTRRFLLKLSVNLTALFSIVLLSFHADMPAQAAATGSITKQTGPGTDPGPGNNPGAGNGQGPGNNPGPGNDPGPVIDPGPGPGPELEFDPGTDAINEADTDAGNITAVTVTIDRTKVFGTSAFQPGITHVDRSLLGGDSTAVNNAKTLVKNGVVFQNTHIMGWGTSNPWPYPSAAEPNNWASLDTRLNHMIGTGSTPIITFMSAPWWMKGQLKPDGSTALIPDINGEWRSYTYNNGITDYRGITFPKGYVSPDPYSARILDNQMSKWLLLVQRTAERYMRAPYNVRYFVVWNEMKGYFNPMTNQWDYRTNAGDTGAYRAKHGYTYMYNQVYQRLRSVATSLGINPDQIKIGGPYAVINTWSNASAGGYPASEALLQNKPYGTYDQRDLDVLKFWLQNKAGASFIALDVKNRNRESTTLTDSYTSNNKFADVIRWIRGLDNTTYKGAASLPVLYIEWHSNPHQSVNRAFSNAVKADGVIKVIRPGGLGTVAWGGVEITTDWKVNPSMYTDTSLIGGGQALLWYNSYKGFRTYFPPGTQLLSTTQSNNAVTVLASPAKTVLVNHNYTTLTVTVNKVQFTLNGYEVRFINTP